jgi:L-ascorbate metabolism protein UlaG (beta-lactamase superfamily)
MKLTKLGHCCLLIETKGKRILTDPGSYTIAAHSKLTNIDYILFTHEHADHYHLESLKDLMAKNPQVGVYANNSVSELLAKEAIKHTQINDGDEILLGEVSITGIGHKHAEMHSSVQLSSNTGYFIDGRL